MRRHICAINLGRVQVGQQPSKRCWACGETYYFEVYANGPQPMSRSGFEWPWWRLIKKFGWVE